MKHRNLFACGLATLALLASVAESAAFVPMPLASIDSNPPVASSGENIHLARAVVRRGARVNVRRGPTVNVHRGPTVVVRRPVRVWGPRPYYGRVVAGVALGTVIAATAVAVAPRAPARNLCWFWSDASQASGYWDYCVPPR